MRIAVPLDENKENVCVSFGRAPYFLISDTETGVSEIKENKAAEAQGGAGIKTAQFVVDQDAEVLITVRCGENAAEVLKAAEISIYRAEGENAAQNVKLYEEQKLAVLDHFHAGFHGIR